MENKEITIYELIGLIKDGKAPKKIKIDNYNLHFNRFYNSLEDMYYNDYGTRWINIVDIKLNTKIEILPEENDEWENIDEYNIETAKIGLESTYNKEYIISLMQNQNKLIKNQKHLKEKLENKDEI